MLWAGAGSNPHPALRVVAPAWPHPAPAWPWTLPNAPSGFVCPEHFVMHLFVLQTQGLGPQMPRDSGLRTGPCEVSLLPWDHPGEEGEPSIPDS